MTSWCWFSAIAVTTPYRVLNMLLRTHWLLRLEWSQSKSNSRIGVSALKNLHGQNKKLIIGYESSLWEMILHRNYFKIPWKWKKIKPSFLYKVSWSFGGNSLESVIKVKVQYVLFQQAELNLQSDLLFDHSRHTCLKVQQQLKIIYLPIIGKLWA